MTNAKITDLEDTIQTVGISVHQMAAKIEEMNTKIQMIELDQSELSIAGKRLEAAVQSANIEKIQLAMQQLDSSEGAFATLRDHVGASEVDGVGRNCSIEAPHQTRSH